MQKVYLLLRNNRQTGPYSLEEVLQMNLKPFDLVWVEGRSAAWRYPGEIETLKAFVPEAPTADFPFQPIATEVLDGKTAVTPVPSPIATSKKIFVRMPVTGSSAAVTPPQEVVRNTTPEKLSTAAPELHTRLSRSMEAVEEDFTNWNYQKKTAKKAPVAKKELLIAAGILALIVGGYAIISKPSLIQPAANQERAVSPVTATPVQENTAIKTDQHSIKNETPVSPPESIAAGDVMENKVVSKNKTVQRLPVSAPAIVQQESTAIEEPVLEAAAPAQKEPVIVQQEPTREKKKLGAIIRSVFKKDRKEETVAEEQPPAADGRQAKRREAGNATDEKANLASMIDLDATAPDSWMMGINGMKVTLRNRSNTSIQSATVIVSYFDANKKLLQTKTIRFSNVGARGKATMPAPDHQFADHTTLELGTITTSEDRYASF